MSVRPAAVCLAAGEAQRPVLRATRAAGYAVIAVDRNADAPGFADADVALPLSTYEPEPIIAALRELADRFRPVGVVNRSSGPPVRTAAAIAAAFALPGMPPEAAAIAVDKGRLLPFAAARGLATPWLATLEAGAPLPPDLPLPLVVKPALSLVGKGGVVRVTQAEALPEAVAAAAASAVNGRVNIERAVDGDDVSLVALVIQGQLQVLALLDEINRFGADGQARGLAFAVPSRHADTSAAATVTAAARKLVAALGLVTCPALLSFRLSPAGVPHLIEAHLDLGGDRLLDHLLPVAAPGFDPLDWCVRALCGDYRSASPTFRPTAVVFGAQAQAAGGRSFELWHDDDRGRLAQRLDALREG